MKQRNLLTNFEYKSYDSFGIMKNQNFHSQSKNQIPFLEVKIDFEAGKLTLQADSQFILQYNRQTRQRFLIASKERVQVKMDIIPRGAIDLNDSLNGMMFPLEGNILDESIMNACSGMLVLENNWCNTQDSNLWRLSFYIYDHFNDYDEIKFDLPLYLVREFQMN